MSILPRRLLPGALVLLLVGACTSAPQATPTPTPEPSPEANASPTPRPTPTPTPVPTPTYTNPPDEALSEVIPGTVGSATVQRPAAGDHALTPGDIGEVFGEIGLYFRSLAVAFVESPRLTLFAMRMDEPAGQTEDLEPHLPMIGQYVGIAELDPDAWELSEVAGRLVWSRPGGSATLAGTQVYTWIAEDLAFLMIGVDDEQNRALIAELPGVPAPTPSPSPSPAGTPGTDQTPSPSPAP